MKRLALTASVVAATLTGVAVLWVFRELLLLLLASVFLAAAIRPVIEAVINRGVPAPLARIGVYGLIVLTLGLLAAAAGRPFLADLSRAMHEATDRYGALHVSWQKGTPFQASLASRLPSSQQLVASLAGEGNALVDVIVNQMQRVASLAGNVVLAFVLSIYWSVDQGRSERLWLSLLPPERRIRARDLWREIEKTIGSYLRSELVQGVLAALTLGLGYGLLGVEFPLALAVVGGLLWFIPILGGLVLALLAFFIGSLTGFWTGLGAAGITLLVLVLLETTVEPRLFNRGRFSSLLIILMLAFMVEALGLWGFVLAPPLAIALQIAVGAAFDSHTRRRRAVLEGNEEVTTLKDLETRLVAFRERVAGRPSAVGEDPQLASLLARLEEILARSHRAV